MALPSSGILNGCCLPSWHEFTLPQKTKSIVSSDTDSKKYVHVSMIILYTHGYTHDMDSENLRAVI